jgi:hypothetical protein
MFCDRDRDEALGHGFSRSCGPSPISTSAASSPRTSPAPALGVQRLVRVRAEDRREEIRLQLAEHDVGVGDRQRPAAAIGSRPGHWRRPNPGRRGSAARRRNAGSSRRPPPPYGSSIIGARSRTPATSVSKARSYSPSKWATSVEVPPMSKPITRSKPASLRLSPPCRRRRRRVPTRIASLPWKSVGRGQAAGGHHEHQAWRLAGRPPEGGDRRRAIPNSDLLHIALRRIGER